MNKVIVQVVQHLRPGGIETMALDLMQQLESEVDVHIVSLEGTFDEAVKHWPRIEPLKERLHFFDKKPGLSTQVIWDLRATMRALGTTVVHTHHIGPLFYGGFAAKLAGVRSHIHTEHDAWHLSQHRSARFQSWMIRTLRPTVVADCEAVANELQNHVPHCTPEVILNGIDTGRFIPPSAQKKSALRKRLNLPEDHLIIGCAARLERVKGHEHLLDALSGTDNTTLLLAGGGSLRTMLETQAIALGLRNRVRFLGALDNVVPFYQALDLFCLPSLNEGLPLSPLEAQACGVPVIISDVGGCRSIVCPHSGSLIAPGDTEALRQTILYHQYKTSSSCPRAFVLTTGNLEKTARAYFELMHPATAEV